MCDDDTEHDLQHHLSRRQFTALTGSALAAFLLATDASAAELAEQEVAITTPDGRCDAFFVHPAGRKAPGVLIWPDILGLRPAFRAMAKRLAAAGYAVLVVNPFYRSEPAPVVAEGATFTNPDVRTKVIGLARTLSGTTHRTDAASFVAWLDAQPAVDTKRKLGTTGYCMGGPMVFRTASSQPARIGAAASFHGGGLVTDDADSPHAGIPKMTARLLVAVAKNDDERAPADKTTLETAFDKAGLKAEIEVYDAMHGWCPPDMPAYDEARAERAWTRLLALLETL